MFKFLRRKSQQPTVYHDPTAPWRTSPPSNEPIYKSANEQKPGEELWTPEELLELHGAYALVPRDVAIAQNLVIVSSKSTIISMYLDEARLTVSRGGQVKGLMGDMPLEFAQEVLGLPEKAMRARMWDYAKQKTRENDARYGIKPQTALTPGSMG